MEPSDGDGISGGGVRRKITGKNGVKTIAGEGSKEISKQESSDRKRDNAIQKVENHREVQHKKKRGNIGLEEKRWTHKTTKAFDPVNSLKLKAKIPLSYGYEGGKNS